MSYSARPMATKKKPTADAAIAKTPTDSTPKPKPSIEVDWGKGFVEHHDAVVSDKSIKVPVPLRVRQTLGQSQSRDRYDRIKVKMNGQEVRIGERRFHRASSESEPSLTFEVIE